MLFRSQINQTEETPVVTLTGGVVKKDDAGEYLWYSYSMPNNAGASTVDLLIHQLAKGEVTLTIESSYGGYAESNAQAEKVYVVPVDPDKTVTTDITVTATAESGDVNRYVVTVFWKNSSAEIDVDADSTDDRNVTRVGGKAGTLGNTYDTSKSNKDEHSYYFSISAKDVRIDENGVEYVRLFIVSEMNAAGNRSNTITLGGVDYVGYTRTDAEPEGLWVPVTFQDDVAVVEFMVKSEDGSTTNKHTFTIERLSANSNVTDITVRGYGDVVQTAKPKLDENEIGRAHV